MLTGKKAVMLQKILWNIRWILLASIMIFNFFAYFSNLQVNFMVFINGSGFALYFILWQLESYVECMAGCRRV